MNAIELYFDGASRSNGTKHCKAGAGWYAKMGNNSVKEGYLFIGNKTNNEAEYTALIKGLESIVSENYDKVLVKGDSLLVINQMNGVWKVKASNLIPLYKEAKLLSNKFKSISFEHIDRSLNTIADSLANKSFKDSPTNGLV